MANADEVIAHTEIEQFMNWQSQRMTRDKFLKGFAALMAGYTAWEARALAENAELDAKIAAFKRSGKK